MKQKTNMPQSLKSLFNKLKELGLIKDESYEAWHFRKYGKEPEENPKSFKEQTKKTLLF